MKESNDSFYVFTPHARDYNGLPDESAKAVLLHFSSLLHLTNYVTKLAAILSPTQFFSEEVPDFEITPFGFNYNISDEETKSGSKKIQDLINVDNFNTEEPKHPVYRSMYTSEINAEKEGMKNSTTLSSEIKQKSDSKSRKEYLWLYRQKKALDKLKVEN